MLNAVVAELGIYMKESKRTHRFYVTLSFAPKRSFDRKVPYIYIYIYIYIYNCSLPCDGSVQGDLRNLGIPCRSISDN